MDIEQELYYRSLLEEATRKKKRALKGILTLGLSETPIGYLFQNAEESKRGMSFGNDPIIGGLFKFVVFLIPSLIIMAFVWIKSIFSYIVHAEHCHRIKKKLSSSYNNDDSNTYHTKSSVNNNKSSKKTNSGCWTAFLIIAAIVAGVYFYIQYQDRRDFSKMYPAEKETIATSVDESQAETVEDEEVYEEHYAYSEQRYIQSIVEEYTLAVANNDFATLEELYAPQVSRYINENYLSRDNVLAHHRRYDEYFQVYGKHSSVRWNTLDIRQFAEDKWYVEYIEDFTLDRYDPSLFSVFVRKMRLILNENYKIVSVEEEILEKGYQE